MLGRGLWRRVYLFGSVLLLAASLHAPTAYSAPGDPPRGSPAESVYELPLQQGREDAAPKNVPPGGSDGGNDGSTGGGTAGTAGSGASESGSLYRTENNFGSSSRVPSAPLAAGGMADNGRGAGGSAGEGAGPASGTIAGQVADSGNTSVPAGLVLLGAIALLAAAVAILSRRFSRLDS